LTIIVRPRPADRCKPGLFNTERMLDWPDGAVSAERSFRGDRWRFTYQADVLRAKRERMVRNLRRKREAGFTCRRALYVWVFWCPGVLGFAFRGWWLYLVGIGGKQYQGGGVKGNLAGELLQHVMELFPIPAANRFPLLGPPSADDCMPLFAREHRHGLRSGKPQGKAAVWAAVRGERVLEIHSRASMSESEQ